MPDVGAGEVELVLMPDSEGEVVVAQMVVEGEGTSGGSKVNRIVSL